jgi:hypothetical protein
MKTKKKPLLVVEKTPFCFIWIWIAHMQFALHSTYGLPVDSRIQNLTSPSRVSDLSDGHGRTQRWIATCNRHYEIEILANESPIRQR